MNNEEILSAWYEYAANRPGFVGSALNLLRERQEITSQQQQMEFGVSDQMFLRLQAMPLPRSRSVAGDAHRIAEACGLANPIAFVQAMILARSLEDTKAQVDGEQSYQAAFDAEDDLDLSTEEP